MAPTEFPCDTQWTINLNETEQPPVMIIWWPENMTKDYHVALSNLNTRPIYYWLFVENIPIYQMTTDTERGLSLCQWGANYGRIGIWPPHSSPLHRLLLLIKSKYCIYSSKSIYFGWDTHWFLSAAPMDSIYPSEPPSAQETWRWPDHYHMATADTKQKELGIDDLYNIN